MHTTQEDKNGKLFAMPELDELLGRIPNNYVLLLEGDPGTGKTSFAINMVCRNIVRLESKALYVTTNEGVDKLTIIARSIGCDLKKLEKRGLRDRLKFLECVTLSDEYLIDAVSDRITKAIIEGYDMIVIDSVTPILNILGTYIKKRAWLHTLLYKIASVKNVLVILVADTLVKDDPDISLLRYLSDVVIKFRFNPKSVFPRSLEVVKFRARPTPNLPIYFIITQDGLRPINLVSDVLAQRVRRRRKTIVIDEEPAKKIFGKALVPGTQVSVIVRYPAISLGLLKDYLVLKLGIEALIKGLKVGVAYYGLRSRELLPEEELLAKALGKNCATAQVDFIKQQIPHHLVKKWISKPEEVDILIVTGYEKFAEFYGVDEVNKMLAIYHQTDSKLGVMTFRIYRVTEAKYEVPSSMLTMSNIVLEVTLSKDGKHHVIKVIRAPHITRPIEVADTELLPVVEELRIRLRELIKEHGLSIS
ncbi:MAG TPA: hypothetical protein ENF75_07160 [Acidilobales archaeon]|nr:hypothetical protein [Acidilobales archaeon]